MGKVQVILYVKCGLIIAGAWIICFLPTVFYFDPLEPPEPEEQTLANISLPSFPCNSPLIFSNVSGFCMPPCDWLSFTEKQQEAMTITDWATAAFCTACFCVVLATWLKLPQFAKFPHIIILFMAGIGATVELLVIIPKFGKRSSFFCSSAFLKEAIESPTTFCQTQGALIHYLSLVTGEMFVVYNGLLLKIPSCKSLVIDKLPSFEFAKTHLIILSVSGLLLPLIPVIYVVMSMESYVPVYLRYCFPGSSELAFYSCILPQEMFLSVGITCLLIVIFKLIKERKSSLLGSPSQAKTRKITFQRIAVGFILVIISYIACVYLTYGLICIKLNNREAYKTTLQRYFTCLTFSSKCSKVFLEYEEAYELLILSFLAGNVFQAGTLFLLASKPIARNLWRSWLVRFFPKCRSIRRKPSTATLQSRASVKSDDEHFSSASL